MPDLRANLRQRLGDLGLPPEREEEILAELRDHLEDLAEAHRREGLSPDEGARQVMLTVGNWKRLREEIVRAESEEIMNHRTQSLWLPAMTNLAMSTLVLALIQRVGPDPYFFTPKRGPFFVFYTFYLGWLATLPFTGAAGAYLSARASGTRLHRLLSGLAPALAYLAAIAAAALVALLVDHGFTAAGFLAVLVSWVLSPALALFAGTLPFLRKRPPHPAANTVLA